MKVLVSGHRGMLGALVVDELRRRGDQVVGFDIIEGDDICDLDAVRLRMAGCDAVIHLASLPWKGPSRSDFARVGLLGTWNLLSAAHDAGVARFIYASSVNALGVFLGDAMPEYLPIDDAHFARPKRDYGVSKLLSERLCQGFSNATGMTTICLRFPAIWRRGTFEAFLVRCWGKLEKEREWWWEYGAYIDNRDAAIACALALRCETGGHSTHLVAANDCVTLSGLSSRELARRFVPDVPWRGGRDYETNPGRSLIASGPGQKFLGFTPRRAWTEFVAEQTAARTPVRLRVLGYRIRGRIRRTLWPKSVQR